MHKRTRGWERTPCVRVTTARLLPPTMQTAEPSRLVDRLRLALALGREQRAAWPQHEHALAAYRRLPPCGSSEPPLVTIGFVTAPTNIERRQRIRAARDLLLTQGERCAVTLAFVVAMFTVKEKRSSAHTRATTLSSVAASGSTRRRTT